MFGSLQDVCVGSSARENGAVGEVEDWLASEGAGEIEGGSGEGRVPGGVPAVEGGVRSAAGQDLIGGTGEDDSVIVKSGGGRDWSGQDGGVAGLPLAGRESGTTAPESCVAAAAEVGEIWHEVEAQIAVQPDLLLVARKSQDILSRPSHHTPVSKSGHLIASVCKEGKWEWEKGRGSAGSTMAGEVSDGRVAGVPDGVPTAESNVCVAVV